MKTNCLSAHASSDHRPFLRGLFQYPAFQPHIPCASKLRGTPRFLSASRAKPLKPPCGVLGWKHSMEQTGQPSLFAPDEASSATSLYWAALQPSISEHLYGFQILCVNLVAHQLHRHTSALPINGDAPPAANHPDRPSLLFSDCFRLLRSMPSPWGTVYQPERPT